MQLTSQDRPVCHEQVSVEGTSDTGPSAADAPSALPNATGVETVGLPTDGVSAEPQRRKKTRKEREARRGSCADSTAHLPGASFALSPPSTNGVPQGSLEGGRPCSEAERELPCESEVRQGQHQHPELYFVGRKAWQWWDPSRDAAERCSPSEEHPEDGGALGPSRLYDKVLVECGSVHTTGQ